MPQKISQLILLGAVIASLSLPAKPTKAAVPTGKIAFVSARNTTATKADYEIFTMNPDGSDQKQLTTVGVLNLVPPSWSPDGRFIAFHDDSDRVWIMDADGGNQHAVAIHAHIGRPSWSPDGGQLTFVSDQDGNPEIYITSTDGKRQQRLTNNTYDDFNPVWSPDGLRIAFFARRSSGIELRVIGSNGENERMLYRIENAKYSVGIASWSPNSKTIAAIMGMMDTKIFLVDAATGIRQDIGFNADVHAPDDQALAWSPDGSRVLFSNFYNVYTMQIPQGSVTNLTRKFNAVDVKVSPTWSPDGQFVAFTGTGTNIYVMDASGGNVKQITTTNFDDHAAWQPR